MSVAAVVIGRNEGERLVACLASLTDRVDRIVYVDSGSTDGSVAAAEAAGAHVVALDLSHPFTAARARNAGVAALVPDVPVYVQFVDGDCAVREDWVAIAQAFLDQNPDVAVVCGRRRERFPDATIYNAMCDAEWDTPPGEALACGGDALMRYSALAQVGGFRDTLIAGEEPELCVRLRAAGWRIWRLDAEMTWHDAAITRFGQWWRRSRRAGHAFAEGAALHGAPPERHWVGETRRAIIWGLAIPVLPLPLMAVAGIWPALIWLALPAQVVRLAARGGWGGAAWRGAGFSVLGKVAEALGVVDYWIRRLRGRPSGIIEYK